jgi:hypothetical protein
MNAQLKPSITIQRERYSDALCAELLPLLKENWIKSESYKSELPVDPAFDKYQLLDKADLVLCITAREAGVLIGYTITFMNFSLHHKAVFVGHGDMIYVEDGQGRGRVALKLLRESERLMKARGVTYMGWFVNRGSKIHKLLLAVGYKDDEVVVEKRL